MQNHSVGWVLPSPFSGSANFSNFQVFSGPSPQSGGPLSLLSPS